MSLRDTQPLFGVTTSRMPAPAPITWWTFAGDELAIFNKPNGLPVLVIGEEGDNIIEVRIPRRVIVPIFTLRIPAPRYLEPPTLIQQIQFRLDALFEQGARLGEGGRFHAVFKSLGSDYLHGDSVSIGLTYCTEDLVPAFNRQPSPSSTIPTISIQNCELAGLPTWVEPPYSGPRPSRYKRDPVI